MATVETVGETVEQLSPEPKTCDEPSRPHEKPDIEHATVHDDPREWSKTRKVVVMILVGFTY